MNIYILIKKFIQQKYLIKKEYCHFQLYQKLYAIEKELVDKVNNNTLIILPYFLNKKAEIIIKECDFKKLPQMLPFIEIDEVVTDASFFVDEFGSRKFLEIISSNIEKKLLKSKEVRIKIKNNIIN